VVGQADSHGYPEGGDAGHELLQAAACRSLLRVHVQQPDLSETKADSQFQVQEVAQARDWFLRE
jgi:hypothetical protein